MCWASLRDLSGDRRALWPRAGAGCFANECVERAECHRAHGGQQRWTLRTTAAEDVVVGQVMLSLVLLAVAGLFVRTLHNLRNQ